MHIWRQIALYSPMVTGKGDVMEQNMMHTHVLTHKHRHFPIMYWEKVKVTGKQNCKSTHSYCGLRYTQSDNASTYLCPGNLRGGYSTCTTGQSDGCALNCAEHLGAMLNGRNHWKQKLKQRHSWYVLWIHSEWSVCKDTFVLGTFCTFCCLYCHQLFIVWV